MAPDDLSPDLVKRLRAGDDDAARAVFQYFTPRLIGLARGRLDARLRQRVDPEDIVQSAYKSFLVLLDRGTFAAEGWDGLWGMLTLITLRKCADRARHHRAGCRDAGREAVTPEGAPEPWREAAGREPTPEEGAVLAETVERLLGELGADERPIIELSLQGYSAREISEELGRAERSVRRLRERVRRRLERMHAAG